ncbi:magnesium transporter [Aestuariibacter halophilus]|uniref:Magnesium transporter n=1 Tax=Fluctibacter halophilus TaxID=226011 RepID=A0ABS8GAP0_9ALTE|nr:magnesium transporter [Aestuariibacter halophilus]MCC2617578.1 magnesium transporter [Aestuariibacter halophilus]
MAEPLPTLIQEVVSAPEQGDAAAVSNIVAARDTDELALLLESLPQEQRLNVWDSIARHRKLEVLVAMRGDAREVLIDSTEQQEWEGLFSDIDAEQLLELADSLPNKLVDSALRAMDKQQRQFFRDASQFGDDQIGHWLSHDVLVLPLSAKVRDAMRLLRREVPEHTDSIFLINRAGQFAEVVRLTDVIGAPEHVPLVDLSEEEIDIVKAEEDCTKASLLVQKSGFSALPVVDESNKLLGRLDIATASELVNEFYERQLMASAGMDEEEDLFAPVKKSARSRAVWLGINLLTAFLASWFIGLFEATLQQVVALAVLMPVVASMGGIAGSQTLTLIIRGLALGQVTGGNRRALLVKELSVGGLNGVVWAIVIGIVASVWFSDPLIGVVIGMAILMNIVAAAFAGVLIPIALDKLKIDPALSGSVILTTVTDIVGFVAFLGLGTWWLL